MRIVTWNCHHGECCERAALLSTRLPDADIVVLQECSEPPTPPSCQCLHFGPPAHGVCVVAHALWTLEAGPYNPAVSPPWVYPVRVTGPVSFHMLAVWAHPEPGYVACILNALTAYEGFLRAAPSVVIGDFNSHTHFPPPVGPFSHGELVSRLLGLGLVSAFHHAPQHGAVIVEVPTHYHHFLEDQQFHIDYCFIPGQWVPLVGEVTVGTFDPWCIGPVGADHVPLSVELNIEPPA